MALTGIWVPTGFYGIFGIHIDFLSALKGGFFLRKKPLECVLSVYSNSENAIAAQRIPNGDLSRFHPFLPRTTSFASAAPPAGASGTSAFVAPMLSRLRSSASILA